MMNLNKRIGMILFVLLALALAVLGQEKKSYVPSELQLLRLQLRQRDAQIAQRDLQAAQARFQQALADLNEAAQNVKRENKWDEKVQFNPDTVTFAIPETPKTPAPVPAPASEAKKP